MYIYQGKKVESWTTLKFNNTEDIFILDNSYCLNSANVAP